MVFFSPKIAAWEAMDPDERPQNFLPKKSVALYNNAFVKDKKKGQKEPEFGNILIVNHNCCCLLHVKI